MIARRTLFTFLCSLFISHIAAQDVTVTVNPVQQVLPPQAGQYVDNPGKFFTVRLTNNTDDEQRVHMGMHIDMLYPDEQSMVVTPTDNKHIPRQPIILAARQTKLLNPVEMKLLFTHFNLTDIYIRDGMYNDYKKGIFGLLPEGQYKLFMHCYKWDPELTSAVLLNSPDNGTCLFNVCYTAEAPKFISPLPNIANDPLGQYSVAKVDKALPQFTWTAPTLNCNPNLVSFTYDIKIVRLDQLPPDEAIERNPVVYQRNKLTTPTLTIPTAYVNQMLQNEDAIYAIQITANSSMNAKSNQLNFTLVENDGKSMVLLFRLYDPIAEKEEEEEKGRMKFTVDQGKEDFDDVGEDYVFEQPTLIKPVFDVTTARKIFVGDDLPVEWREAWHSAGRGERQDTVKFEYTYAIYKGNSADELDNIFKSKPVFSDKTKDLEAKIKWDKLDGKINVGDYLVLRVTATSTNCKSYRMLPDSLNYKDFSLVEHFDEDYACGTNTSEVTNKKPLAKAPKAGTKLTISDWTLEVNGDVKQDSKTKALSGTGFIHWSPAGYTVRVAVKFDKLMVNTDNVVFDGVCTSYPKEENKEKKYSAQEAVDELFSYTGLDNFWGDLQLSDKVKDKVSDNVDDVAKKLKLGEYYTYFKKKQNQWNNIKQGNLFDLYFPSELPKQIADKMPKDFSLQIASMQVSPKACVMNIIGEYVLPKSSIIDNDVLIFGAPRLCMRQDEFLPEDGVIALLSNFKIKDPSSDFTMTFKSPTHPLRPSDGCFLEWENYEFGGLGLNIAMTIPNLRRVVDGKALDAPPIIDVKTIIGRDNDWNDWTARIEFDAFQIEDVPDWTFKPGGLIILDHSSKVNESGMVSVTNLPETYDPSKVNNEAAGNWKAWQGLYIQELSVQFPKWGVLGNADTGEGVTVGAKDMVFDNSGCTLGFFATDILNGKTGKCGGWEFDLDKAEVNIVQNNFDKCHIEGRFAIPLFGAKKDSKNKDPNNGKVKFTCDIRHLTEGETTVYTYDKDGKKVAHKKKTYGKDKHMAYIFRVQQVGEMDWSWCAADIEVLHDQSYFVVAAEEKVVGGKTQTDTHVELALAGDITIAPGLSVHDKLKELSANLPIELKIPGIHFCKLRLANFKRSEWNSEDNMIKKFASDLVEDRDKAEKEWDKNNKKLVTLAQSKEIELSKACYLDLGEWSLASEAKKLGPFEFNLKKFDFSYASKKLKLGIDGEVNLCGKLIHAAAGVDIGATLTIPNDIKNISGYKLGDAEVSFKSIEVGCEVSGMMKFEGRLEAKEENGNKGYHGLLDVEVTGLFSVKCQGGYFKYKATTAELKEMEEDWNRDHKNDAVKPAFDKSDANYSWGYFMVDFESSAGIQIPPIVINRISGGFYFNCAPKWNAQKECFDRPETGQYGLIGASLGVGISTSASEHVLRADLDVNVVYDRKAGHLTTFLFKGKVTALDGLLEAKMTLLYQNDAKEKFLSLDITVETGMDTKKVLEGVAGKYMKDAEAKLKAVKDEMGKFQESLPDDVKNFVEDKVGGLECLNSDSKNKSTKSEQKGDVKLDAKAASKADAAEKTSISMGKTKISFQLKITWKENGVNKSPTRWHLYLGEPAEDKRCSYTYIDFKSPIVNVNIGANGYICVGNELPGNGALPDIPKEISDFLDGGGNDKLNTGSSKELANNSRKQAAAKMLGTNINGGVMVGAKAWGFIDVDLGLLYGNLKAIAGFDMSFINYGESAYCANLNQKMGWHGWYAMGQFYAYLAAQFGLKISLGKLIKERKISIVNAGIGGVFECGLPKPSWVEGRARVKCSLIGGLVNIDRRFKFSCGEYCEAFLGNALDNFNLFGEWSVGTDSIDGWSKCVIDVNEGRNFMFTTDASMGTQWRLVDPTTANTLKNEATRAERSESEEGLKTYACRTYVFNFDKDPKTNKATGARLYRVSGVGATALSQYVSQIGTFKVSGVTRYDVMSKWWKRTVERSNRMQNENLKSGYYSKQDNTDHYMDHIFDNVDGIKEVPVSIRESRGNRFHIQMNLEPGYSYVLMLTGTCYEINNGRAQWVESVKNSTHMYEQWKQSKVIYFRTSQESFEDLPTQGLQPYVALAFPSAENRKLSNSWDEEAQVYLGDILHPTIALNKDIRNQCFMKGRLEWALRTGKGSTTTKTVNGQKVKTFSFNVIDEQTRRNKYMVTSNDNTLTVNMEPETKFTDKSPEPNQPWLNRYNLQLRYIVQRKVETDKNSLYLYKGKKINLDNPSWNYREWEVWSFYNDFLIEQDYKKDFKLGTKYYVNEKVYTATGYKNNINKAKLYLSDHEEAAYEFDKWKKTYFDSKGEGTVNDTTLLADLYFKGSSSKAISWMRGGATSGANTEPLLPYERAFIGIRAFDYPKFTYTDQFNRYDELEKKEQVFQITEGLHNAGYSYNVLMKDSYYANRREWETAKSMGARLTDPYTYFAYLSDIFISGRVLNAYDFDAVRVPHASETLSYSFNGDNVMSANNISYTGTELERSMWYVRQSMFKTWNTWAYNDSNQPSYPLPSGTTPDYDVTRANQDGKATTFVHRRLNSEKDYPYHMAMRDYVWQVARPYVMAEELSNQLNSLASELKTIYKDNIYDKKNGGKKSNGETTVNTKMKEWSNKHRGQYLTISNPWGGQEIKLPLYQLPLLFGACFGKETNKVSSAYNKSQIDQQYFITVDEKSRAFRSSVQNYNEPWSSIPSIKDANLHFWRLCGGYAFHYEKTDTKYDSNIYDNKWLYVKRDAFNKETAFKTLTSLPVIFYRVDTYNLKDGQYYYWGRGAAYDNAYDFGIGYANPLKDSNSPVKGDPWGWLSKLGVPGAGNSSTSVPDYDKK